MYTITIYDGINTNVFAVEGTEVAFEKFEGLAELFPYDKVILTDMETGEIIAVEND